MKRAWQMSDPGALQAIAPQDTIEHRRFWVRNLAIRKGADESVEVEHWKRVAGNWERGGYSHRGKLPRGKMRAAFFQRIAARSSPLTPITSRARSLASPVHIVRSEPQSNRFAPRVSSAPSSIPRSTPL